MASGWESQEMACVNPVLSSHLLSALLLLSWDSYWILDKGPSILILRLGPQDP